MNDFNKFRCCNIVNIILCLILAKVNCTTIIDYNKDSSANNPPDSIEYVYNEPATVADSIQYNVSNKLHIQEHTKSSLKLSILGAKKKENMKAENVGGSTWDEENKLLENSLFRLKGEHEKCLLDSLKLSIRWWCHHNGTLRHANHQLLGPKQQLDLSYRNINSDAEVSILLFEYLRNNQNITIKAFSLAYNNLTRIPFHALKMMAHSLEYLSLMGNPFIDIDSNAAGENSPHCVLNENDLRFFKNRDVSALFAKKSRLLAWATFPDMPSLRELDLSNCDIEYIAKEAFQNLTNLRNLYMSHNRIINIPADTFLYTPHLQVLDLSFANVHDSLINNILHSPDFESVLKLFYGVNIEQNFFDYLPNLVYLDLSHTKLRSRSAVAFGHTCPTLKYLSLCYTSFPVFGSGIFKSSSLIGLDLSGNTNAVFSLDENVFANLSQSLMYLFFEKANLKSLSWLRPLQNLRFLALAGNNINHLLAEDFMPLKQLQILDLSSNHVNNWYWRVFQHNENLRILSLRDNNINFISSAMLTDLSTLVYLSLGSNNFICDCTLHDLMDLSSINNQHAQCKGNVWQIIKKYIHINSTDLPEILKNSGLFNSTINLLDIPSLIVTQNIYKFKQAAKKMSSHHFNAKPSIRFVLKTLKNKYNTRACRHEHNSTAFYLNRSLNNSLFKLQLLDYKEEQYWCYNQSRRENPIRLNCERAHLIDSIEKELNTLTTYVLASVGSLILIASISILVYIKRWHIYYYYSSLKSAAMLSVVSKGKRDNFENLCDQHSNMIYDIFISYCESDREWIVEELMPNIEENGDISVCLHERDFQVGVTILDNIVSCMERSKAIMLIISTNFLLSHWCQFEMQLAHHHILDLSKDNLILVLLEDIPRSKRPKNLQFLISVKTYIKWPGSNVQPEERKVFWKRLKHCLRNVISMNSSDSIA